MPQSLIFTELAAVHFSPQGLALGFPSVVFVLSIPVGGPSPYRKRQKQRTLGRFFWARIHSTLLVCWEQSEADPCSCSLERLSPGTCRQDPLQHRSQPLLGTLYPHESLRHAHVMFLCDTRSVLRQFPEQRRVGHSCSENITWTTEENESSCV